jgi:hypothetical protein
MLERGYTPAKAGPMPEMGSGLPFYAKGRLRREGKDGRIALNHLCASKHWGRFRAGIPACQTAQFKPTDRAAPLLARIANGPPLA